MFSSARKWNLKKTGKKSGYAQITEVQPQSTPLNNISTGYISQTQKYEADSKTSPRQRTNLTTLNRYRRLLRWCVVVSSIFTAGLSLFMEGAICYVMVMYYRTANAASGDRTSPWPSSPTLWPSFMMAGASGISAIAALLVLFLVLCNAQKKRTLFSVFQVVVHVTAWIAVAAIYRLVRTEQDLWGYSCSATADTVQPMYQGTVVFNTLCTLQNSSWEVSLVEIGVKSLLALVGYFLNKKAIDLAKDLSGSLGTVISQAL